VSHLKIYHDDQGKIVFDGKDINGEEVNKQKFIGEPEMAINSLDQDVQLQLIRSWPPCRLTAVYRTWVSKNCWGRGTRLLRLAQYSALQHQKRHGPNLTACLIKPGETFSFDDNLGLV